MTIGREYYDKDGNYWQIETPYYIPPEEAIKHPEYVRGCITADTVNHVLADACQWWFDNFHGQNVAKY